MSVSGNFVNDEGLYDGFYEGGQIEIGGSLTNNSNLYLQGGSLTASSITNSQTAEISFSTGNNTANSLNLNGGTSSISGSVSGTGSLNLNGGAAVVNSGATLKVSNVTLGGNAHVEIAAAAANVTSPFSFANNATATLQLDASVVSASGGSVSDSIVNFGSGDTVDLRSLAFASGATATYNATAGTLAVTSNGVTDTLTLAIPQATTFQATSDGSGGTNVTVICFTTGTRIQTVRGDVAVEDLRVGDMAVTASGSHRPIRWIGNRSMRPADHDKPLDVHPVRVRAEAFGAGLPERDLFLSPGHPVLVGADEDGIGGVLVPIMCLINGTTVARVPVETVTYWHVELDEHDILLAEGLSAESFLDFGCRPWFENAADHALANPDFVVPGLGGRCRPVVVEGPAVEAERRRLDAVFTAKLASHCDWSSADSLFAQMQ